MNLNGINVLDILDMIKQLYATDQLYGYTETEIAKLKENTGALPDVLEQFWREAGATPQLHQGQDAWIRPSDFGKQDWLNDSEYLILLNENQGCCQAGIRRTELAEADSPVYVTMDRKNWKVCAGTISEFLKAALAYEAVFAFSYQSDDFIRWLTEDELAVIQSGLERKTYELHGWIEMDMSFYSNAYDHMVVVMDCGDLEVIYGAASEKAYKKLMEVMEGLGEAES